MAKTDFRFHHVLRVRWAECDPQGIAFNGSFLTWMEVVQAEYYRNLGLSLYRLAEKDLFDTVMVKTGLEFASPARVDDLLEVHARVERMGTSSIAMMFEVHRSGAEDGDEAALARMDAVYVSYSHSAQSGRPVPDAVRRAVERFEATGQRPSQDELRDLATG